MLPAVFKKKRKKGVTCVYAYEDGALYSFEKAKPAGLQCFYDQPIGYWRSMHQLLLAEKELKPEWAVTLKSFRDSQEKLQRKDREIEMADMIFAASSFTVNTLKLYPGKLPEIKLIPYGFPSVNPKVYHKPEGKLKLLYVGGLSQRKGLSYLFDAVETLKDHVSLTMIGAGEIYNCPVLKQNLNKHNWISTMPHERILTMMREHDVLVFPSLFEGFGQVITEAMSQGTPVITTERTAGPDIIKNGENGWLVQAGSAEALKNMIEQLLLQPELIAAVGEQACKTAAKRPWNKYGTELADAVLQTGVL